MTTCFLFTEELSEEGGLCLQLNAAGEVVAPLLRRSIEEVHRLQEGAQTIVVVSSEKCSFHLLELPRLSESKARAVIPFALEEHVAQNIAHMHFASWRKGSHYLIAAMDKQFLQDLIERLRLLRIHTTAITADWFALKNNERCLTEHYLMVNEINFKGSLSPELAEVYLQQISRPEPIIAFTDSATLNYEGLYARNEERAKLWIAQRLIQEPWVNFFQGEFKSNSGRRYQRWWLASFIFLGIGLASWFGYEIAMLTLLNKTNQQLDAEIAVIYREFFPGATQIISPKFRIEQLLNHALSEQNTHVFRLVAYLGQVFKRHVFTINQYRLQNDRLQLWLVCKDFATLEQIETGFSQLGVTVRQIEATTQAQQVVATLEVTL